MKKKILILAAALVVAVSAASAQEYEWGIGLRGGGIASGLDAKVNLDPANSLRMILSLSSGVSFYGLYERHVPVIQRGFRFYYGAGAHLGTWSWSEEHKDQFTAGFDAVAGLEYKVLKAPFVFSAEWKPCLNFCGDTGFKAADFALVARYTF